MPFGRAGMVETHSMTVASTQLQFADYLVLAGYFVLMLGIGGYFYRYMKGMKQYFSGGNQIPWWLSGVSFYMTSFSAFAFVFYSALAYQYGWVAVTLFWVTIPATFISVMFFSARWRRARIDSPVEYIETRYSHFLRQLFAWQGVPVKVIDDALKLIATGIFVSVGLGLDMRQSMFWSGVIILAYTFMGGLWAVAVTDFIQFVVMAAAITVVFPLSLAEVGGVGNFFHNAPAGFFNFTNPAYSWAYVISNITLFSISYSSTAWSLIQRYYCVPKERDAMKVGWLVIVLYVVTPPLMFIPAMAARQFLPALAHTDQVYPALCAHLLPAGMVGLIIAAMFSATMSTLSADYNICANVLTNDLYKRLIRPRASEKELVFFGRLMTFIVGILALVLAFLMARGRGEQQFRNMVTLFSIATAPVGIPMILGLLSKRMTNRGAVAGFFAGVTVGLILFYTWPDKYEFLGATWRRENVILFTTAITTTIVMVGVSYLLPQPADERRRAEAFLGKLAVPIGRLDEDRHVIVTGGKDVISPFRVTGVSTALIGVLMLGILPWVKGRMAFGLDLWISGLLLVAGVLMTLRSRGRDRSTSRQIDKSTWRRQGEQGGRMDR
jgi:SSS family solute:Na+ symporter